MVARFMVALLAKKDKKVKKPWPWPDNYTLKLEEFITGIINKESAAIYSGGESITFPNGLILKQGTESVAGDTTDEVTYGTAFPTAFDNTWVSYKTKAVALVNPANSQPKSGSETSILEVTNGHSNTRTINWYAIGH